jgi:hypothetical protein
MHSMSMYALSVRDHAAKNADNKLGNLSLDNLRGLDLLTFLNNMFSRLNGAAYQKVVNPQTLEELKAVYKVTKFRIDGRFVSGWFEYGHYGVPGKIINVDNSNSVYRKTKSDSDIFHLYFCFYVPKKSKIGIALFHKIGVVGAKSVIDNLINSKDSFQSWSKGLKLRIKPITREADVEAWMKKAQVKKIMLERVKAKDQFSDICNHLSNDAHVSMTITAPRGKILGTLHDWVSKDYAETVLLLDEMCGEVKTEILVDGKRQMTSFSNSGSESKIDITNTNVIMNNNFPTFTSIDEFAKILSVELISSF